MDGGAESLGAIIGAAYDPALRAARKPPADGPLSFRLAALKNLSDGTQKDARIK